MANKIIITGASSGIGAELVRRFAGLGWCVFAVARRRELLQGLQAEYPAFVIPVVADITTPLGRFAIAQAVLPHGQGIYLIHNAGIAEPMPLDSITEIHWQRHFQVNVEAPVLLTNLLLAHLRGGRVLIISSSLAHRPAGALTAYGTSKAAMLALKNSWNAEFNQKYNILFASAQPGTVDTPIQDRLREYSVEQFPAVEMFKQFKEQGQLLSPQTAAKFIEWLICKVSNDTFITGEWNIYDVQHHKYWAEPGEVVQRNKCPGEVSSVSSTMFDSARWAVEQYGKPVMYTALGAVAGVLVKQYFAE